MALTLASDENVASLYWFIEARDGVGSDSLFVLFKMNVSSGSMKTWVTINIFLPHRFRVSLIFETRSRQLKHENREGTKMENKLHLPFLPYEVRGCICSGSKEISIPNENATRKNFFLNVHH